MDHPDRGTLTAPRRKGIEPSFTQPVRQIFLMLVALGLVGFGTFVALPHVLPFWVLLLADFGQHRLTW